MDITIPDELTRFLSDYPSFYIVSHEDPDADALASSLALGSFLKREGKTVRLFSPGPFKRPEIEDYRKLFSSTPWETDRSNQTGCVILDCSTRERIGNFAGHLEGFETAVIDHHAAGRPFGSIRYIVPEAPSVTFLIQHIIETRSSGVTKEEAEHLLLGLCTDTGFFRHLETASAPVFESTARLVRAGASPKSSYQAMYGRRRIESRLLLGRVLSRLESLHNGKVLYTYETLKDREDLGDDARDSDILYNLLQSTRGVDVIIYLREEAPGTISAGLRSSMTDVSAIAQACGGGGHKRAAGFTREGTLEDVKTYLLEKVRTISSSER